MKDLKDLNNYGLIAKVVAKYKDDELVKELAERYINAFQEAEMLEIKLNHEKARNEMLVSAVDVITEEV